MPNSKKRTYKINERWKKNIQTASLMKKLQDHALSDLERIIHDKGVTEVPVHNMTDSQIRAAFGLLAKVAPDVQRVEHVGDEDAPEQKNVTIKLDAGSMKLLKKQILDEL